ncbi:MAG TPA: LON peptidase substrate-binding domain-containing protein, partial [Spirochaetia bacterium]|nr:LON peptidase substrate-binding domain-containing protein [Spirochaetia bacterium]
MKAAVQRKTILHELPIVPLRELVVFPHMVVPFFVGRPGSLHAVEEAMNGDRLVLLACQTTDAEDPGEADIHKAGTVSKILQMLKLPDGKVRVLAEGKERALIQGFIKTGDFYHADLKTIPDGDTLSAQTRVLMSSVHEVFKRYVKYQKKVPPEALAAIEKAEYPEKLIDLI